LKDKQKRRDNLFSVRPPVTQPKKTETPVSVGIKRQRLFNLSIDLLCIATLDGWFQDLNPAWERVLGFSCEELYSKPYLEFVHPDDRQSTIEAVRGLSSGNVILTFENRYRCRDGSYRWLSWNSYSVPEQGLVYAVVRDVTDRRQLETAFRSWQDALQKTSEELEAANEELLALNEKLTVMDEELKQQLEELEKSEKALVLANQQLLDIIEFLPDAAFVVSQDKKVIAWNRAMEEMTGVPKDDIIGKGDDAYAAPFYGNPRPILVDLIDADDVDIAGHYGSFRRSENTLYAEVYVPSLKDGSGAFLWVKASPLYDPEGKQVGAIESIRDITEHEKSQEALSFQKAYFEQLFENIPQGIVMLDSSQRIVSANNGFKRLFQYSIDEIVGRNIDDLVVPDGLHGEAASIPDAVLSGNTVQIESVRRRKDGSLVEVSIMAYPILVDYNRVGICVIYGDLTDCKRAEDRLKYLSLHDPLTGLYNRAYFEEEMHRLEGDRYAPVGIIVCDVDGLKLVNDSLGHEAGDELLLVTTDLIRRAFCEGDMVSRIGGDEFAVLIPNCPETVVTSLCQKIRNAIEVFNEVHHDIPLSISIGFAVGDGSKRMTDLFKEADDSMYREKLHRSQSARSAIVQTLMKALEARDFITEGHADRLQDLVSDLARAMGLPISRLADIRLLAQFHDIGKVGIPDRILFKPQQLTPEERTEMQRHCEIGHRIALSAPDLAPIADWILKHHEWWNGQGYPLGLKGEEIPLECRILAIADAYDAMTNDRPYRKAMSKTAALEELRRCTGSQFDPELTQVFVQLLSNDEPG